MSGWGEVEKEGMKTGGRFFSIEAGESKIMRILDEEPHTTWVHKMAQVVNSKDTFRTIPATTNLDDDHIQKVAGIRYPATRQFSIRAFVYDAAHAAGGEIKVVQGGPQIFKALKKLFDQFGSLTGFDVSISRTGEKRETEYTVTASPVSKQIDVPAQKAVVAQTAELQWANLFPAFTKEDQIKAVTEAGFDLNYDPAAALAETMPYDLAKNVQMTFGKYKGKTMGELAVIDASYLQWAGQNVTSDDSVAAACRVVLNHIKIAGAGEAKVPTLAAVTASTVAATPAAAPVVPPKANAGERQALLDSVNAKLMANQGFRDDPMSMVDAIKASGGGKTKVKDLTVAELTDLLSKIS